MKEIKFVTYEEASKMEESGFGGTGGWFKDGQRWTDYLDRFELHTHPTLEMLRESIIKNKIRCTGDEHQNGFISCPVFPDGKVATYSFRAWGDLMAAVWSEHDNKDYNYMTFYM